MLGEPLEDAPLARGGVLEFVDEQMLREADAAPPGGVERAVGGRAADEPGDVVERHHPVARHEPVGSGGVAVEEIADGPCLGGRAGEDHRSGQADDRPEGPRHGRVDRLLLILRLPGEELRHHPLREQALPIGGFEGGDGVIAGIANPGILEVGRAQRLDRGGELFARRGAGHRQPVPGGRLGIPVERCEVGDDRLDRLLKAGRRRSPRQLHHERRQELRGGVPRRLFRRPGRERVGDRPVDRPAALDGQIGLGADRPGGREPEFEAGRVGAGYEERVERPHRQPVDIRRHPDEEIPEERRVGRRPIDRRRQGSGRLRGGGIGGVGQPLENAGEDLPGRLAREGGGEDVVDVGAVGEEADEPR